MVRVIRPLFRERLSVFEEGRNHKKDGRLMERFLEFLRESYGKSLDSRILGVSPPACIRDRDGFPASGLLDLERDRARHENAV